MEKNLVVVESPAKAKTIKKFLGSGYKIEASMGHVRDLPRSQIGVDIENDFEPTYITIKGKGQIISKLKKEAQEADKVFLATDPDREGEAISWHIFNLLNIDDNRTFRISFNEITKNAVKKAINNPKKIDMNLVDAQQARRVLDRLVGYKISPILWKKIRRGLSAGRVQSVAVRIICDREEEIEAFVPKEYWTINAKHSKKDSETIFESKFYGADNKKLELSNKNQVKKILNEIDGQKFIVKKIKKSEKKRTPYAPFITSTMQQEASRKLGFTTKKTMMIAQQLYEGINVKGHGAIGLVTYIRTDSTRISADAQKEARNYIKGKYGKDYIPEKPRIYKNKSASQDAHESIRPTHINFYPSDIKGSLSGDQYKLYRLIWERFIASQMSSAIYDTVSVDIAVLKYLFRSTGSTIKFSGFIALYEESKDDENETKSQTIPELKEGEELVLKQIDNKQSFTQPPSRYTEATLVKILEERGIGRPSTYSPTISTILARGYVEKKNKNLFPSELGKIVNDVMKKHFNEIVDLDFTASMENQLDEVEEGQKKWSQIMKDFYTKFIKTLNLAEKKIGDIEIRDEPAGEKCEKCGREMVIKFGRFGKFIACPGFPECKNTKPYFEEAGVKCPKCGKRIFNKKTKRGRTYLGCENYPECDFMTWDKLAKEDCPKCKNFLLKKYSGKKVTVKCSNEECDYERVEDRNK